MPSKEQSNPVLPTRSRLGLSRQDCSTQDELGSRDTSSNCNDADAFKESGKEAAPGLEARRGFRFGWSRLRLSVYRRDKIDEMKNKIREQEEEIQRLRDDIERYKAAVDELQEALQGNRFSSHVHFGEVYYGTSNIFVVDQAKNMIEELSKMMTETLSDTAELKHKAEENEALLKEYMDSVMAYIVDMKNHDTQSKSVLEKEIAELSASYSDEQVFFEGIWALQEGDNLGRMITSFDFMPKKSKRAVQRLVRKYGTRLGAKRFANFLSIISAVTIQNVVDGEDTDHLDKGKCAAVVIEWVKNPDSTPEKFLDIVQNIDKLLVQEEAEKLVAEKKETLSKELKSKYVGDAASNSSDGSTIQSIGSKHSGRKSDHQLLRDQMAHIAELCDYAMRLESKVDQIKKSQEEMTAIMNKAYM